MSKRWRDERDDFGRGQTLPLSGHFRFAGWDASLTFVTAVAGHDTRVASMKAWIRGSPCRPDWCANDNGTSRPLVSTAAGKVVLAFMSERDCSSRLLKERFSDWPQVPQFLDELATIRRTRIAQNDMTDNHIAFAAPILSHEGRVSATITMVLDKMAAAAEDHIRSAVDHLDRLARSHSHDQP